MNIGDYYSFKIFPRFWLVKTTRIVYHKQLLLTKNSVILNQWRQKCSPLQIIESLTSKIIEPLTEKTWAQGCVIQQRQKWPRMNNKAIIEFGFRRIWRIVQISASVNNTLLDLQNSSYPTQPHSIIANYSMSPSWVWSDKITNERVARVGYNHFISNKGEWNNCFSKFSNRVLPPIFISTILQRVRKEHTTSGHTRPDSRHHLIIT